MSDFTAGGRPGQEGNPGPDELPGGLTAGDPAAGNAPEVPHPHRVIGTPPPAEARTMLGESKPDAQPQVQRELPGDPPDLDRAKKAELVVAACFIVSMLAGIGFIVAYLAFQVHSVTAVLHSNLALGTAMGIAFLAMGVGATVWVRHLMPDVELTEARKPLASAPQDRQAFAETFTEGTEASQFVKRPLVRRTLIAATLPVALAPVLLLRDMGPLPRKSLDFTVWRRGIRLIAFGSNRPLKPADFDSPGGMITVVP